MEKVWGMYRLDNHTNSYGKGADLAISFFAHFNGKINPLFPARCLIFGRTPEEEKAWACTIGDIIQIDIHKIMRTVEQLDYSAADKVEAYKGLILYCVAHELFHLEQDVALYFDLTTDKNEAIQLVEDSCHCATTNFLVGFGKFNMIQADFLPYNFSYIRPLLETFTGWGEIDSARFDQNLRSYYTLTNPYHKALWYMNGYIMGNFSNKDEPNTVYDHYLRDGTHTLMASVYVYDKLYRSDYLAYLGQWSSPRAIMDMINPLILVRSQGFNGEIAVESRGSVDTFPGTTWLNIWPIIFDPFYWQIVEQLPSDQQPIPPIL